MADDQTQTLNGDETPEQRILSRLDAIDARLTSLEAKAEERARDTRPLFEQAIKEMQQTRAELGNRFDRFETEIRRELRTFAKRLDVFAIELNKTQAELRDIDERLAVLEQKPA
jgi:septation ring formation regulator EzrA